MLHDYSSLKRFLAVDFGVEPEDFPEGEHPEWLKEETERLRSFVLLLIELAAARAWSQSMFAQCSPNNFAGVLHTDRPRARQLFQNQKLLWESVLKAEQCVKHNKLAKNVAMVVSERLAEVAWNQMQLAREVYVLCCQNSWDADVTGIQQAARDLFGGPWNTKYDLEDTFAHLASINRTYSQATPMNKPLSIYLGGLNYWGLTVFIKFEYNII